MNKGIFGKKDLSLADDEEIQAIQEMDEVLQGMVKKGLIEVAGVDEAGETMYRLTDIGKKIAPHISSDKSSQN